MYFKIKRFILTVFYQKFHKSIIVINRNGQVKCLHLKSSQLIFCKFFLWHHNTILIAQGVDIYLVNMSFSDVRFLLTCSFSKCQLIYMSNCFFTLSNNFVLRNFTFQASLNPIFFLENVFTLLFQPILNLTCSAKLKHFWAIKNKLC